jgi:cytochrome oxidase Cu insertion factor (SCO1/SenC/PrrC family)
MVANLDYRMLTILCNSLLLLGLLLQTDAPLGSLQDVQLRDQYGYPHTLAAHHGRVVVVMVVDAKRLRNLRPWAKELGEHFDNLETILIAEVPSDPPTTYERVVEKLSEKIPDEVSVLIDMKSLWAQTLNLDASRPNLLLIDRNGHLTATYRGSHEPGLAATVVKHIEVLLAAP